MFENTQTMVLFNARGDSVSIPAWTGLRLVPRADGDYLLKSGNTEFRITNTGLHGMLMRCEIVARE